MEEILLDWLRRYPQKERPLLMAHRGNRDRFPENTMAAFQQAVRDGADILETDLHLTRDGKFVCIHDATIDRTMNGGGAVQAMTFNEIKQFRALDKGSKPSTQCVPGLAELADFLPEDTALALELKSDRFLEKEVCDKLIDLLDRKQIFNRTIVLSFSMERLDAVKRVRPQMPIGWISVSRLVPNLPVDLIGSFWPAYYLNPFYVKMAHARGILTCPLDPRPDSRLPYYLKLGVDAVLSDDPGTTRITLDKLRD